MDLLEKTISASLAAAAGDAGGGGACTRRRAVRVDGSHTGVAKNALLDRFRDDDACIAALLLYEYAYSFRDSISLSIRQKSIEALKYQNTLLVCTLVPYLNSIIYM